MALVPVRLCYTPEPLQEEVVVVEAVSMPGRSNDPALRHNPPRRVTRAVARHPRPAVSALLRHAARPAASQGALNPH